MIGVILAAGKGSRIASETEGRPKSFLEVNGKRIIDWQINALREHGIKKIVIVIGYRCDLFEAEYGQFEDITLVKNPFFDSCNVLGSLWFAQKYLNDGFYFMHADTLYDKEILKLLEDDDGEISFAVEFKSTTEEEMKVKVKDHKIYEVNKTMPSEDGHGEFTGVAKISKTASPTVVEYMNKIIEIDRNMFAFFEVATQEIINDNKFDIKAVDIDTYRSVEIDFPEDFERAQELFI